MTHDAYRGGMLHEISGAVDSSGTASADSSCGLAVPHALRLSSFGVSAGQDWTEPLLPPPEYDPMAVEGLLEIPYEVPNQRVEQHRLELDVPVSVWRTTGHGPNNFALESFMDELASAARMDPLALRRRALAKNARAAKVLDTLAEKSDWGKPLPAGMGRGIALAKPSAACRRVRPSCP